MKAKFIKAKGVSALRTSIQLNLERYREGDFLDLVGSEYGVFETDIVIDPDSLHEIVGTPDDQNEARCCQLMFQALDGMNRYVARDERLWVHLTHVELLNYARSRWPIPADDTKAVKHIEAHFFARSARDIDRNNACSRLWWIAFLCNRVSTLPLEDALTCLLYQSDVRANIIERPTTAQNRAVFEAVISTLDVSYKSDKALFERSAFREFMKRLNLEGGHRLLSAMSQPQIQELVANLAEH